MITPAPPACLVDWTDDRTENQRILDLPATTHSCSLPADHVHWPVVAHLCGCGTTLPVRDVDDEVRA